MASLIEKKRGTSFCGGTLVASKWVLSASHCLYQDQELTVETPANEIEIKLGEHDESVDDETDITKTIQLETYIKHPNWNKNGDLDSDIAMLKLAEEVDLSVFTPACMAKTGDVFVGKKAWAYGKYGSVIVSWVSKILQNRIGYNRDRLKYKLLPRCTNLYITRPILVRICEARVRDCCIKELDIFGLLIII